MDKKQAAHTVEVLRQAFPYLKRFRKQYIVIKLGGSLINRSELLQSFTEDIGMMRLIGMYPILIHGGGTNISESLKARNIKTSFENGMRVTDARAIAIVEETLASINKNIVSHISQAGFEAVAYAQSRYSPIYAKAISKDPNNKVGQVHAIDDKALRKCVADGAIPVLSPIGRDSNDNALNINADIVAGRIASTMKAAKLILLTDVAGIQVKGETISEINQSGLNNFIENGTIAGGMLPKVLCALDAINSGIARAHIIDGRVAHAVLLEIFTEQGIGTMITPTL